MGAEDYALIVGINDYRHAIYSNLDGAKRDAQDFIEWIKSPAGGGVPDANVDPFTKLWVDGGRDPELPYLWGLLRDLRKRAPEGKKRVGRRLYIFLAGHGISPLELDEAGLVTVDADDGYTPHLAGKENADKICLSGRFEEVLLFMDCCRVPDVLLEKIPSPFSEKPDPVVAGKVKRFYAFATALGKVAREADDNGVVRGIFSRALLRGLNGGAPPDAQGRLTTTQLRAFLESCLKTVKINGEEQVPKFPLSDEIVLVDGLAQKRVTIDLALTQPAAGIVVLDGGDNLAPVIPTDDVATPRGRRFRLPAGKSYVIRAVDAVGQPTRTIIVKTTEGDVDAAL